MVANTTIGQLTDGDPIQTGDLVAIERPGPPKLSRKVSLGSMAGQSTASYRPALTADRIYYVRKDGSDSNTGLADTAGGAFLTIQRGIDVIYQLDFFGYNVTLYVRAGTYTESLRCLGTIPGSSPTPTLTGDATPAAFYIIGDETTPANVFIDVANDYGFRAMGGALVSIRGFKFRTTTSGDCINASLHSTLYHANCEFGACAGAHISAFDNSAVYTFENYKISGGAVLHYHASNVGMIQSYFNTVTLTGTPAFSTAFGGAGQNGTLRVGSTFVGSATGPRRLIHHLALNDVGGASDPYYPGDSAGSVDAATGGFEV